MVKPKMAVMWTIEPLIWALLAFQSWWASVGSPGAGSWASGMVLVAI